MDERVATITYKKIAGRDNKPIKFDTKKYPQFKDLDLPRNYFAALYAGQRGSGKTDACIKLLKMQEQSDLRDPNGNKVAQRVILFCPTIAGNMKFYALKNLDPEDVHTNYTDEMFVEVLAQVKAEKEETDKYHEIKALIKKYKNARTDLIPDEDLLMLYDCNFELPPPPKYPNGVVTHIVLDDLLSSCAFKSTGKSVVTDTVLNGRHINVNIHILAQNLMALPKSIRINCTVLIFFRFGQKKVQEDIYDECSGIMSFKTFQKVYDEVTNSPYCFLCIDHTQKREDRIKKCFDNVVNF